MTVQIFSTATANEASWHQWHSWFTVPRCVVAIAIVFVISAHVHAQATFTPLGLFGGQSSRATDVSADGKVVVGTINVPNGRNLFRWTTAETLARAGDFGEDAAVSADASVVVGTYVFPPRQAFIWTTGGAVEPLSGLAGQPIALEAYDVSGDGSVVVGRITGGQAFRWTQQTGTIGLGGLAGGSNESWPTAVSTDGAVIVGFADDSDGRDQAFRWTADSGMVGLGLLPNAVQSQAHGVSADGSVVVGQNNFIKPLPGGTLPRSLSQAFRWTMDEGIVPLFDLPESHNSIARGISADGSVVVGRTFSRLAPTPGDPLESAYYWTEQSGRVNLRQLLVNSGATGLDGWTLTEATSVSADGLTVVGTGTDPNGALQSFVATIPETSTLMLAALAATIALAAHIRKSLGNCFRIAGQ